MGDFAEDRHIRIVVEVERRAPTQDELDLAQRAIDATPNAIERDFDAAWSWSWHVEGGAGGLEYPARLSERDDLLQDALGVIRHGLPTVIALELTGEQVPLDRRYRELIGCGRMPARNEVAEKTAALLQLPPPTSADARDLLVTLALVVQQWYDNPGAPTEATHAGVRASGQVFGVVGSAQTQRAIEELGLERGEESLWYLAADLLGRMGIEIW